MVPVSRQDATHIFVMVMHCVGDAVEKEASFSMCGGCAQSSKYLVSSGHNRPELD